MVCFPDSEQGNDVRRLLRKKSMGMGSLPPLLA
jgi:hypothetical protein